MLSARAGWAALWSEWVFGAGSEETLEWLEEEYGRRKGEFGT
jgi:hypothetical protein